MLVIDALKNIKEAKRTESIWNSWQGIRRQLLYLWWLGKASQKRWRELRREWKEEGSHMKACGQSILDWHTANAKSLLRLMFLSDGISSDSTYLHYSKNNSPLDNVVNQYPLLFLPWSLSNFSSKVKFCVCLCVFICMFIVFPILLRYDWQTVFKGYNMMIWYMYTLAKDSHNLLN